MITADELLRRRDDGWRYELRRGELVRYPYNGMQHAGIVTELACALHDHVEACGLGVALGPVGHHLFADPDTVRAPDVSFIHADRTPQ